MPKINHELISTIETKCKELLATYPADQETDMINALSCWAKEQGLHPQWFSIDEYIQKHHSLYGNEWAWMVRRVRNTR